MATIEKRTNKDNITHYRVQAKQCFSGLQKNTSGLLLFSQENQHKTHLLKALMESSE